MLVLDLAGNHAERPIGDVPGDGAAKLPRVEDPAPTVGQWDGRHARRTVAGVEMGAEPIDLSHHMRQATVERPSTVKYDPYPILAALDPMPGREPFSNFDRARNGRDRDPFLDVASGASPLLDHAPDCQTLDNAVGAS